MDSDPTPGDPAEVRDLADRLQDFADDVGEALGRIRGMAEERAVLAWAGLSADAFRSEFDSVPGNLEKLRTSYDMAGQALQTYWPTLDTAQGMADRALERAVAAQADLSSARAALDDAQDWVSRAGDESDRLQRAGERESVEPPSEAEVRAATRDATAADEAARSAQGRVDAAEEALSAARELARQAKEMREDAARVCAQEIEAASDAGIQNRSWWEEGVHWVSENWDTIVEVCKVVVAVLGIVVMIIGGPLAWVVLAAALIVLADTLYDYANGEASLWDVAFAALDCIPGFKGLTTAGGLLRMASDVPGTVRAMTGGLRTLTSSGMSTVARAWNGEVLDFTSTAGRGAGGTNPAPGVVDALRALGLRPLPPRPFTAADPHSFATRVFPGGRADGQTVLAGHGYLRSRSGEFVVPEGTTISFYIEHGDLLNGLDGVAVEAGVYPGAALETFNPGDVIPNYTLGPPEPGPGGSFSVMENSTAVSAPTTLSELLSENMGTVHWAACRELMD